ncbi:lipocalin-like domain-containing protein (plasmid) [Burkholderia sp. FERM BP-3421]|jgi:Lipocalin-like domain|uniref:Uncharacterized protein fr9Q n=1 Tax=Pseudomonas sp. 2663 TaxID=764483 RepID=E9KSN4_9PSED|nr:lipocalin-like domain-containing protein [Burkholderia sp. FERM BP-3421]ADH01498.1 hypothetical protein [Pseudomonas sp. 2663]AIC32703.1 FR9Q [Burkholderia sp. FERM BP-3421]WDD90493.1 lipocalin-like domain-containing protein [Burkholderia sp. FERM BP-3421]
MSDLTGSWSLEESEFRLANGNITYPLGRNPSGRIIYMESGHMSVLLIAKGRANVGFIPEKFWLNIFGIKRIIGLIRLIRANSGVLGYSGRYSTDGKTVLHHVDLSSYPDFVGTRLVREVRYEEGRLVLENSTDSGSSRLVWAREI